MTSSTHKASSSPKPSTTVATSGYDDVGAFAAIGRGSRSSLDARGHRPIRRRKSGADRRSSSAACRCCSPARRTPCGARPRRYRSQLRPAPSAHEIRRVLDRERLTSCFSAIVAAEDTPRSKPAPDPYERAVELLRRAHGAEFEPHECVAVEDSNWGLESARQAGLRTLAVAQSYPAASVDRRSRHPVDR